jgi:uncharacterized protein YjbJ (UPF0337 family)
LFFARERGRPIMSEAHGKADELKGRVERAAGDLADDDDLRKQGKADEAAGAAKQKAADAERRIEDGIDRMRDAVKDKLRPTKH